MSSESQDLIDRLRPEVGCCAFCGNDPYHYVDIGVGMERVAVTCCDEGIALYQHGDEVLSRQVALRCEAADLIERLQSESAKDGEALKPFAALADMPCKLNGEPYEPGDNEVVPAGGIVWADLRAARSRLARKATPPAGSTQIGEAT